MILPAALLVVFLAVPPDDAASLEIQKLLGPSAPLGKPGDVPAAEALDGILLKRGREFADALPIKYTIDVNGDGAIDYGRRLLLRLAAGPLSQLLPDRRCLLAREGPERVDLLARLSREPEHAEVSGRRLETLGETGQPAAQTWERWASRSSPWNPRTRERSGSSSTTRP